MADVEGLQKRHRDVRAEVEELSEREEALKTEIGAAVANGDEGDLPDLREELSEIRSRQEELSSALPVLEKRIREAERERAHRQYQELRDEADGQAEAAAGLGEDVLEAAEDLLRQFDEFEAERQAADSLIDRLADEHREVKDSSHHGMEAPTTRMGAHTRGWRRVVIGKIRELAQQARKHPEAPDLESVGSGRSSTMFANDAPAA